MSRTDAISKIATDNLRDGHQHFRVLAIERHPGDPNAPTKYVVTVPYALKHRDHERRSHKRTEFGQDVYSVLHNIGVIEVVFDNDTPQVLWFWIRPDSITESPQSNSEVLELPIGIGLIIEQVILRHSSLDEPSSG